MQSKEGQTIVNRRLFLKGAAATTAVLAAAGCQPQEKIVEKVVTQVVEKEKIVEKAVTQVVEKQVTQVVEKEKLVEKVVTATAGPAKPKKSQELLVSVWTLGQDPVWIEQTMPWYPAAKEWEKQNTHIKIKMELGGGSMAQLMPMYAAGTPPDIQVTAMTHIMGTKPALSYAYQLDISALMTKEDREDYDPNVLGTVRLIPQKGEFIQGWPLELWYAGAHAANQDMLEAQGIDWKKIQTNGWTWDEYVAAGLKLIDPAKGLYLTAYQGRPVYPIMKCSEMAGNPDSMDGLGWMGWGNVWNFTGPELQAGAQFMMDWIDKYKFTTPALMNLPDDPYSSQLLPGKIVMSQPGNFMVDAARVEVYNRGVKEGKIAGKTIDTKLVALPVPYRPGYKFSSYARGPIEVAFKQNPYKGDEHTEATLLTSQFFASKDMLVKMAKWGRVDGGAWGKIPARLSAMKAAPLEDQQAQRYLDYCNKNLRWTHPYGHPAYAKINDAIMYPNLERLVAGKINVQQFDEETVKEADKLMLQWVQTEPNTELVEYWGRIPEGWPGDKFPKWKQRTPKDAGYPEKKS